LATGSVTGPEKSVSKREGEKVDHHPNRDMIVRMLRSGWVPARVERWLRDKYPDQKELQICEKTLWSYRSNFIALNLILPSTEYEKKLKEFDIAIDTLDELYKAIAIQKQRVSYNLAIEDKSQVALPDTRKEMELLAALTAKALEFEMRLGIRKEVPAQLHVDQRILSVDVLLDKYLEARKQEGKKPLVV
jgi:hypothetical protein